MRFKIYYNICFVTIGTSPIQMKIHADWLWLIILLARVFVHSRSCFTMLVRNFFFQFNLLRIAKVYMCSLYYRFDHVLFFIYHITHALHRSFACSSVCLRLLFASDVEHIKYSHLFSYLLFCVWFCWFRNVMSSIRKIFDDESKTFKGFLHTERKK